MGKDNNKQPKPQMVVKQVIPQVVVTLDTRTKQILVTPNFKDWNQAENMLIDGLRAVFNQRMRESKNAISVAQPRIIIPGA